MKQNLVDTLNTLIMVLRAVVIQMGGVPPEIASQRRRKSQWQGLHEAVLRDDAHQTARELDRAERRALASYELALVSEDMTPPLRTLLGRHRSRLQDVLRIVQTFDN